MFIYENGGRLTDNRSSCVILEEMRKKANIKEGDNFAIRNYITSSTTLNKDSFTALIFKVKNNLL